MDDAVSRSGFGKATPEKRERARERVREEKRRKGEGYRMLAGDGGAAGGKPHDAGGGCTSAGRRKLLLREVWCNRGERE